MMRFVAIGRTGAAFLAATGAMAVAPGAASGAGKTYEVVACHELNRGVADVETTEPGAYGIVRACADPSAENAIRIGSRLRAGKGREGVVRWIAPEETGFVHVRSEAKLRRGNGHYSRIYVADDQGREVERIAVGDASSGAFHAEEWRGSRQEQFVAVLGCDDNPGCPVDETVKTWIRDVRMELADYADPSVVLSGSLVGGDWKRGEHALTFQATDLGSGLTRANVSVNGSPLTAAEGTCDGVIAGTSLASSLTPCESDARGNISASTASLPFHDGSNSLVVCGIDFAGNQGCQTRQVDVDNAPPSLAFTSAQDPADPELIHAPVADLHSGVAGGEISYRAEGATIWQPLETVLVGGELQARVDSSSVPEGTYEFRATASDVAGNQIETTRRSDGLEMRLAFPLKAGVELDAALTEGGSTRATIDYGQKSGVKGILRDASGEAIADQEVVIVEFFGEGALIRERVTRVQTDDRGRWTSRLPAGPSRRVTATYEGSQRYLADTDLGGRLAVRTKASFSPSKARILEGERLVFRGRLGRLGASIPSGGKLLELQVKQSRKKFQTVGEGFRTRSTGRFSVPYKFGDFYTDDVRFKFRVKVAREADWPYKAPVRSKSKTVTVLAR